MTILHYLSDSARLSPGRFVIDDLLKGQSADNNILLACKRTEVPTNINGISVYQINFSPISKSINKQISYILADKQIDILHLHGLWGIDCYLIYRWAKKHRLPIVVSPYKDLMPWNLYHKFIIERIPRMQVFMKSILCGSHSLLTFSFQETESIDRLNLFPRFRASLALTKKTDCIDLPKACEWNEPDYKSFTKKVHNFYRKTIDSNPFLALNDKCLNLEDLLISIGLSIRYEENLNIAESNLKSFDNYEFSNSFSLNDLSVKIRNLNHYEWRNIQIHASEQGVLTLLATAISELAPEVEIIDISKVNRFGDITKHDFLDTARSNIRKSSIRNICNDWKQYKMEQKICIMIVNLYYQFTKRTISRQSFVDLYSVLRYEHYNDYVLEQMMSDVGLLKFTKRIMYILQVQYYLLPGFTPVKPKYDKKTKSIISKLFKSNIR